jgi:N-acetylmuramoyl-L-alanine amidase
MTAVLSPGLPPALALALPPALPFARLADPSPPRDPATTRCLAGERAAVELVARTIAAEGRDGGLPLMTAIAAVIANRWRRAGPGRADAGCICCDGAVFACWAGGRRPPDIVGPLAATCRRLARRALAGTLADPTAGATRYHHQDAFPRWSRGRAPDAQISDWLFYDGGTE